MDGISLLTCQRDETSFSLPCMWHDHSLLWKPKKTELTRILRWLHSACPWARYSESFDSFFWSCIRNSVKYQTVERKPKAKVTAAVLNIFRFTLDRMSTCNVTVLVIWPTSLLLVVGLGSHSRSPAAAGRCFQWESSNKATDSSRSFQITIWTSAQANYKSISVDDSSESLYSVNES